MNRIFRDIRFWLIGFFIIRLVGITHAPLEAAHNWRQSLTNMIARNFYQTQLDLMHPMIDMAGEKSGIIGSEFPFFNFLIYLVALFFGYDHWYGRLINLVISTLGVYFFYRLIREMFNNQQAFHTAIILLFSIWFSFSRKIMPDTFSVSLVIIGMYCSVRYLKSGKWYQLPIAFTLITLGVLCKIPSLSLLAAYVVLPFIGSIALTRRVGVLLALGLSSVVVYAWYFVWVPHLLETYQFQLYFPKSLGKGFREIVPLWSELLEKFYFSAFWAYSAFVLFLYGSYRLLKSGKRLTLIAFGSITVVFALFIVKTGDVFPTHSYYIIPFVPLMAFVAAMGSSSIPFKWGVTVLMVIGIESIANQHHDFFVPENQKYKLEAEGIMDTHVPTESLVVLNGGPSPQPFYFLNRKGWNVESAVLTPQYLDSLQSLGCEYLVLDKNYGDVPKNDLTMVAGTDNYEIFSLREKGAENQ